jgi:methylphosphotriester-DNA--protein-cysteine methyltransferase
MITFDTKKAGIDAREMHSITDSLKNTQQQLADAAFDTSYSAPESFIW